MLSSAHHQLVTTVVILVCMSVGLIAPVARTVVRRVVDFFRRQRGKRTGDPAWTGDERALCKRGAGVDDAEAQQRSGDGEEMVVRGAGGRRSELEQPLLLRGVAGAGDGGGGDGFSPSSSSSCSSPRQ